MLSKVAWVGRTASMVFGLALILVLVVGANGDFSRSSKERQYWTSVGLRR